MGLQLEDGKGSGELAQVESNRLRTTSTAIPLSNHITLDIDDGGVFTMVATHTWAAPGTFNIAFLQNTDPTLLLVLERIMVEPIGTSGGTAIPNAGDLFSLAFNTTYTAAGTPVVPVNLNRTSTKVANVTAFSANPTLGVATILESHRWYPQANGVSFELIRPETDDIVLGRNNTIAVRYTTLTTAGTALVVLKFFLASSESMG